MPAVELPYSIKQIAKEAVVSGRSLYNDPIFYAAYVDKDEELYGFCTQAFFMDPKNAAAINIMRQLMATNARELQSEMVSYYRS